MERSSSPAAGRRPAGAWLAGLVVAACAVWVFRGALDLFFAADDFPALARVEGLLPRLQGPWRLLSAQLYFDLMHAAAGLDPRAYHAASLLLHAACAGALYVLLKRRLSAPAAMAGAAWDVAGPLSNAPRAMIANARMNNAILWGFVMVESSLPLPFFLTDSILTEPSLLIFANPPCFTVLLISAELRGRRFPSNLNDEGRRPPSNKDIILPLPRY